MQLTLKKYTHFFNIKISECTLIFRSCKKIISIRKCVTFTHGSKTGGMATCIVIYLKTVLVDIFTY